MRKLLALPLISLSLSFAVNVPQNFIDAYKQGKEDEFIKIKNGIKDLKGIIQGMLKFREYLLAGKIPPPIVVEEKNLVSTPNGIKVEKRIRIYFPSDLDYAKLEDLAVKLTKDYLPLKSGYYVYFPIGNLADYQIGYLKLQLKKLNYQPFVYKDWLIAGVYSREANAKKNTEILNRQLHKERILNNGEDFKYVFLKIGGKK